MTLSIRTFTGFKFLFDEDVAAQKEFSRAPRESADYGKRKFRTSDEFGGFGYLSNREKGEGTSRKL
jgi:hypothetical protein